MAWRGPHVEFLHAHRWHLERGEWRVIESLNAPPPRCSHQVRRVLRHNLHLSNFLLKSMPVSRSLVLPTIDTFPSPPLPSLPISPFPPSLPRSGLFRRRRPPFSLSMYRQTPLCEHREYFIPHHPGSFPSSSFSHATPGLIVTKCHSSFRSSPLPLQAVCYREHLYVFGGEFGTSDQFYHYRDLWR
jgi:hypothetical protein